MRFVYKEKIVTSYALCKESLKTYIRVKYIVIVTNNVVAPARHIQTEFKWTYFSLNRIFIDYVPVKNISRLQKIVHSIIYSVEMPFGVRTVIRVTLSLIVRTYLVLCCYKYSLTFIAILLKNLKGISCNNSCHIFSSKIKNPVAIAFPHSFYRRKNCRYRLSRTGWSLSEKNLLPNY